MRITLSWWCGGWAWPRISPPGAFVYGLPGIAWIAASQACIALLSWGTVKRQRWAWWGGLVFWGLFTLSTIVSFANTSWIDLLRGLALPAVEVGWLDGIPFQGWHLALMTGMPLAGMWGGDCFRIGTTGLRNTPMDRVIGMKHIGK